MLTLADILSQPVLTIAACFFGFWILLATIDSMHKTTQRERTSREIAAYVAEGSITAADAGHLMESQQRAKLRDRLADLVAEQWIEVDVAEKILGSKFASDFDGRRPAPENAERPRAANA